MRPITDPGLLEPSSWRADRGRSGYLRGVTPALRRVARNRRTAIPWPSGSTRGWVAAAFSDWKSPRQARRAGHSVAATFHSRVPAVADVDWRNLDIRHRDDVMALVLTARPDV